MNIISVCVQFSPRFKYLPLYFYLKVTTLCSALFNFLQILFALAVSRQFINVANSLLTQGFLAYVASPLNSILFFYKCILDAIISLDRIAIFKPSVKERMTLSPCVYSLLAFLIAVALNIPHVLLYQPPTITTSTMNMKKSSDKTKNLKEIRHRHVAFRRQSARQFAHLFVSHISKRFDMPHRHSAQCHLVFHIQEVSDEKETLTEYDGR